MGFKVEWVYGRGVGGRGEVELLPTGLQFRGTTTNDAGVTGLGVLGVMLGGGLGVTSTIVLWNVFHLENAYVLFGVIVAGCFAGGWVGSTLGQKTVTQSPVALFVPWSDFTRLLREYSGRLELSVSPRLRTGILPAGSVRPNHLAILPLEQGQSLSEAITRECEARQITVL